MHQQGRTDLAHPESRGGNRVTAPVSKAGPNGFCTRGMQVRRELFAAGGAGRKGDMSRTLSRVFKAICFWSSKHADNMYLI